LKASGIPVRVRRNRVGCKGSFEPFGIDYQAGTGNGASDHGIYLRLPGQWDDGTWDDATSGAGVYYNVARWMEPGTGRYTRTDPLGFAGDPHPYLYAWGNPLSFIDPLGERSRVCCTPITEGGPLATFKHCFIETEDDTTGQSTTRAVQRVRGKGCKYENDPFDTRRVNDPRTECGPWQEKCGTDQCVAQGFNDYPSPSDYQLIRGPNSNSFASTITNSCSLTPPPIAGTAQTPGWGKEGRPAKNKRFQCPATR